MLSLNFNRRTNVAMEHNGGAMRSCATHYRIKLAHTLLAHDV